MNDEIKTIETIPPFTRFCMTIGQLPTSYLMSMTYYEQLVWLTKYLQDNVIPAVNNNAQALKELQEYVAHYFDNLDIQEEINNKLDEMADSGQLTDIIAQYLGLAGMITFNNVSEMKEAENLVNGSKCSTLGYTSINDGGCAIYKVRTITNDDVIDEGKIIALHDDSLIAELIVQNNTINPIMFGCIGDNTEDDSVNFLKCIQAYSNITINLMNKEYNLPTLSSFSFNKNTTIKNGIINIDNIIMRNEEGILDLENVEIKTNSLHDYGSNQKFIIFQESGDTGSIIINNCKLISDKTTSYNNIVSLIYLKDYENCIIKNSIFKNKNENTTAGGCIWLSAKTLARNNVIINNNDIYNTCKDEAIGLYDVVAGNYTEISNNVIESTENPQYCNTLYGALSKETNIINNTIKGNSTEYAIYDITNSYRVVINNNTIIHNAQLQLENNKSGIYTNYTNINADYNIFNAINCANANYNIQPVVSSTLSYINGWTFNFDTNNSKNQNGTVGKNYNCVMNEVYNLARELHHCTINSTTARLNGNIKAYNTTFNITNGVTGGYATGEIVFKNCTGGIFANSQKCSSLTIENSSVNYCYGALDNYTNNQSRLDSATTTSGHIFYSSMNNQVIDNLTRSS